MANQWNEGYGELCGCCSDIPSCVLFGCAPCTCGITGCFAKQYMADYIGTDEAKESMSFCNQCLNCLSWCACSISVALWGFYGVGPAIAAITECFGYWLCPYQMHVNLDYRLFDMANKKLDMAQYPGPSGMKEHHIGWQASNCCTAWCNWCMYYRRLKEANPEAEACNDKIEPEGSFVGLGERECGTFTKNEEWGDACGCCEDCMGCMMFSCFNMLTCGITGCCAKCQMGEMIGTEEAKNHLSCKGQCMNCLTYCFIVPYFAHFCCEPEMQLFNYDLKTLEMVKETMGYSTYPAPASLPLSSGAAMISPWWAPLTWCMMLRTLKKKGDDCGGEAVKGHV